MTDWTRHVVLITNASGKGHGSGFVIRRAGVVAHVVTCAHVVADLGDGLEANGRPAKVLWDGTKDGIDLAVLAAEGLAEDPLTLTRRAGLGDAVVAVGFTQVDRGRRASARPATVREATQLTYDPGKVVKKHAGWLLSLDGEPVTDGFSGGPVVAADTGMVIGVLGLRGTGTADAIAIGNLAAWRDAPPAVNGLVDEVARLRRSSLWARGLAFALGAALAAAIAVIATRRTAPMPVTAPVVWTGSLFGPTTNVADDVAVAAVGGWQLSRQTYRAGERVCVEPRGFVTVAHADVDNLAIVLRPLLVKYAAAGSKLAQYKRTIAPPVLTEANRFRYGWVGPEGGAGKDGVLDECLLRPDAGWGALLGVEMHDLGYGDLGQRDPVQILAEDGRTLDDVRMLGARRDWVVRDEGHLAFIVNDAILTDRFVPARPLCADGELARAAGARALASDLGHALGGQPGALLAYADNGGGFSVRIRRGACAPMINTRTAPR